MSGKGEKYFIVDESSILATNCFILKPLQSEEFIKVLNSYLKILLKVFY